MAADVQIRFRADSKQAQQQINQLEKEVQELRQQLGQTNRTATESTAVVDKLGNEAREAAIGVTSLGRNIFKTSAEAKRFGGVFTDMQGRIRESNGEFAKTREVIDRLGDEARESARDVDRLGDQLARTGRGTTVFAGATDSASRGSQIFTRALGGVGRVLGELGLTSAIRLVGDFATGSVKAAGELEQYIRATEQITGSAEAAAARIASLEEIANLPGLNFEALTRFSNRLIAAGVSGSDADKILLTVGQTVVSLGGDAAKAGLAMEQLIQAIQLGTIDMRDFRTIVQQIPGFLEVLGDVHGVAANLDGLHDAFDRVGGNMRELLIPTFDELARRYESPPPDSYIVSMDRLQNSFFLLRAELGEKVLPAVSATARGLSDLFDGIRDFLNSGLPTQSATDFAIGLEKINSAASRQQGIEDRVNALRRLELALKAEQSGLSESSDEYLKLSKQIQDAQAEQDRWNTILEGSPQAVALLESEIAELNDRYGTLNERLNQTEGTRSAQGLAQTQRQVDAVSGSLSLANNLLSDVKSGFEDTADAAETGAAAARGFVRSIEDFGGVFSEIDTGVLTFHERAEALTGAIREMPPAITAVRGEFDVLAPTAARVAEIFREYNEELGRYVAVSGIVVSSAEAEAKALDAVTQSIIQQTQDAEGLADVLSNLEQRTDAHNAALVNPAVSDAAENMRLYIRVMDDVQGGFESTEDISERLTVSIRDQASAFDALRSSVAGVSQAQSGLQGQQLGSGIFDQFDARTPGSDFGTSFADNLSGVSAKLGQELASQAIRTAGELKRIEEDRVENLEDLEREYSEKIVAINEHKREQLADIERRIEEERVNRLLSIEQAFSDAAAAEVEARQQAADRIQQIEERAAAERERLRERINDRLIALEERRDDRIQDLSDGFIEREQDRQQEILEITQRAAEARTEAEQQYATEVQAINNRLVADVLSVQRELAAEIESLESGFVQRQAERADEIVRITEEAADARAAANQTFTDTMQGIYDDLVTAWDDLEEGFTERQEDRAEERVAIEERAAAARVDAHKTYNDTVARISTDLVDEIRDIQGEITEVIADAAADRIEIEQEAIDARTEANTDYAREIEEIEADRDRQVQAQQDRITEIQQRITEIQRNAVADRLSADQDYADAFQDIQNSLVDSVVDIQRSLNDTLSDLRQDELNTEQARLDSLAELHEGTAERIADIERGRARTIEDLYQKSQDDIFDAQLRARRRIEDLNADRGLDETERAERIARVEEELSRRIEDITRRRNRRIGDLAIEERRQREDLARQQAEQEVQITERAAARLSQIEQQTIDAQAQAQEGISAAESAAGVSFQEAQANYVPALNSHEQALLAHAEALNRINEGEASAVSAAQADIADINARIGTIIETAFQDAATAAMSLAETLSTVDSAEQQRITDLNTSTTGTLTGLNQRITDAEARTGLSFEEALQNYTPAVDLNTQALQALTEALERAETERTEGLGAVDAAGVADRLTTQTAQQALETGAGVSIDAARANFVPALSSAAEATLTLNETMRELESSFRDTIAEIHTAGLVDRQAVDAAVQAAIADATAQQTALETQAGTTFADASLAFQPGLSDIEQAGIDRDTAISGIDQTETEGIDAVNAQSLADRLETDAAITEARDAYIKARDTEIFQHNTAMLQLNLAEAADIKVVRATLSKNLESIDDKLDLELEEIRETKIIFDTRMNELIEAVNAQANEGIAALRADVAGMRESLELLVAEQRNDAWKGALLKIASVGITVAGVAAGTALGNPAIGFVAGQAVGGLVEEAGNELFHFPQTDRIARNIARQETLRRSRATPAYLPDANQIRNSRDLSREIVRGVTEGLDIGNRRDGGVDASGSPASFPEEMAATIIFNFADGGVQEFRDQILRLEQQDR